MKLFNSHIEVVHLIIITKEILENAGFQLLRNICINLIYRDAKESLAILFHKPTIKLAFNFVAFMGYLPEIVKLLLRKYIIPSNI
jgi:hypothetical protein